MNSELACSKVTSSHPPFVVIAGNLGAGKTTLARRLSQHFDWWVGYESVVDNPFLADFYADMRAWAFHLQVYFLADRLRLHRQAVMERRGAILDRSIYEDRYIFAPMLYKQGHISARDCGFMPPGEGRDERK